MPWLVPADQLAEGLVVADEPLPEQRILLALFDRSTPRQHLEPRSAALAILGHALCGHLDMETPHQPTS